MRTNWIGRAPRVAPTGTFPTADAGALEVCACVEEGPQRRLCDPPDVYSRLMRCSGSGGPGTQRCASQRGGVTQRVEAPKPFLGLYSCELGSVGRGRSDKRENKLGDEAVLVTFGRGCSSG